MRDDEPIAGYAVSKPQWTRAEVDVHLAMRTRDAHPVVLRVFRGRAGLERARQEHRATQACAHPRIARALELRLDCEAPVLVLERLTGTPLERWLGGPLRPIERALEIGVGICELLSAVHDAHWVHGDLSPDSVQVDPDTFACLFTELASAHPLGTRTTHRARGAPEAPGSTGDGGRAHGLQYIAPEQTGLVKHGIDARTDLYRLGATLYHLVTGSPPFEEAEPAKLPLAHVTREPPLASDVLGDVPRPLARVLARLLKKDPADRYPDARVVGLDLETIRAELVRQGAVPPDFSLPSDLARMKPRLPSRLHGREHAAERLAAALDAPLEGSAHVFVVRGPSGAGKSSLAQSLRGPIVARGGRFVVGCASPHHDRPYAAFAEALRSLADSVLVGSEDTLDAWRRDLRAGLGQTAEALVGIVPELAFVLGEIAPGPRVGPREARARLCTAIERCLRVASSGRGPLALILEDFQCADADSLFVLRHLLDASGLGALVIGVTLRATGSDRPSAAESLLANLRGRGPSIETIELGPLSSEDTRRLVEDMLDQRDATVGALAEHVSRITGNLPGLVQEFIERIHSEGLLRDEDGAWTWDPDAVAACAIPEGAVAVMTQRLEHLCSEERSVLELASCFDDDFSLDALRQVSPLGTPGVEQAVYSLLSVGLLRPSAGGFQLAHDRLREGVEGSLEETARAQLHLRIGLWMLAGLEDPGGSPQVFEAADHLNMGAALLPDDALAPIFHINLRAGQRALGEGAGAQAARYFERARALLGDDACRQPRALVIELHLDWAESLILCSRFDEARALLDTLERRELSRLEFAQVAVKRIYMCALLDPAEEAVESALGVLRRLGVRWPLHPSRLRIRASLLAVRLALRGRSFEDALAPAPAPDPGSLALLLVLNAAGALFSRVDARLGALATSRAMRELLKHGYPTPPGFTVGAVALYSYAFLRNRERALEDARSALRWLEREPDPVFGPRTEIVIRGVLYPFFFPRRRSVLPLESASTRASEACDPEYGYYAQVMAAVYRVLSGDPVESTLHRLRSLVDRIERSGYGYPDSAWIERAYALLRTPDIPTAKFAPRLAAYADWLAENPGHAEPLVRTVWMLVLCTYRRFDLALAQSNALGEALHRVVPWIHVGDHLFYRGVALAGSARLASAAERRDLVGRLRRCRKALRGFAQHGPDFEHMATLLDAEHAALTHATPRALELYATAVRAAAAAEFQHHVALAHEQNARFLAELGRSEESREARRLAAQAYRAWGARSKAESLER